MFTPVEPQPNFPTQEEEILKFWQNNNIFKKSVEKNEGKPVYVIYDGPPTANAKPPLHTMVPMSFKDLVGRYFTMKGFQVPRQSGWDTHGLPVEVQMEKKLGLSGKKDILNLVPGNPSASIEAFNKACRQSVWEFKQEWDEYVPRVGYWTNTEKPYVTYDSSYIEKTWGVFKQIWDKDVVYKGYKVVPYCPRCGTTLSSHEVAQEYHDVKDVSVFVQFPLVENPNRSLIAWTTTPWTLPGNVALAVGDEIEYVVVKQQTQEYIVAKSRLEILKDDYVIVETLSGSELLGLEYLPLYAEPTKNSPEKKHYVVSGDFVTTEDGSGIVHLAAMYGEDDFNLGKQMNLPMVHTVGPDGHFLDNVPEFKDLYIRDALVPILKSLQSMDRLYGKQSLTHSYPFCWRCKTALIYYATDSWFIAMSSLRSELVANNGTVEWHPEHIKTGRFGDFIKEARDWAISRERFWGTPMPVWTSKDGEYLCVGSFAELRDLAKDKTLIPDDFDPHRPFVDDIILIKDGREYTREPVVLDVWFDSGAMPYASGREEAGLFPADYIAEATDQTRGWFYTLMAISTIIRGQSAYKRVVCMGLLLDEHGKKMSKSVGNIFDPWETFKITGVDAIRWWIYTVNPAGETKSFSIKDAQTSFRKSLLLWWNVVNYFITYANLANFSPLSESDRVAERTRIEREGESELDRWVLSRQSETISLVTGFLDTYDFMRASRALEAYIGEISTWYLRRSRKRNDAEFFSVMHDILLNLSLLMAPMTPFLSEKIYSVLKSSDMPESVHLCDWPVSTESQNRELEKAMDVVRQVVELGLSIRAASGIKVRQPLAGVWVASQGDASLSEQLQIIIAEELNVLSVHVANEIDPELPQKTSENLTVALDTVLNEELVEAGLAREFLRHIQQLRKTRGLSPGETVTLVIDPIHKGLVEPLLQKYPFIMEDAFIRIDPETSWSSTAEHEVVLNGETIFLNLT